jgi:hypothetical protein
VVTPASIPPAPPRLRALLDTALAALAEPLRQPGQGAAACGAIAAAARRGGGPRARPRAGDRSGGSARRRPSSSVGARP